MSGAAQSTWFSTPTNDSVNAGPVDVICKDFNGDGFIDLASASYNSNQVSILLGSGSGTFGSPTNFAVGTNPQGIISMDFNGDGKLDIAMSLKKS